MFPLKINLTVVVTTYFMGSLKEVKKSFILQQEECYSFKKKVFMIFIDCLDSQTNRSSRQTNQIASQY